jgi:hypothetical protein
MLNLRAYDMIEPPGRCSATGVDGVAAAVAAVQNDETPVAIYPPNMTKVCADVPESNPMSSGSEKHQADQSDVPKADGGDPLATAPICATVSMVAWIRRPSKTMLGA